jgi:nitrate reductase gamma subunit
MNFILGIIISSITLVVLVLIPLVGVWALDLRTLFGVVIPYLALITFFVGLIVRVVGWARSPVPFRIPTTGGQQWSLPWVKHSRIDNPKRRDQDDLRGSVFSILVQEYEASVQGRSQNRI